MAQREEFFAAAGNARRSGLAARPLTRSGWCASRYMASCPFVLCSLWRQRHLRNETSAARCHLSHSAGFARSWQGTIGRRAVMYA